KTGEQVMAAFNRIEQVEGGDGATGAVGFAILVRQHQRRFARALDHSRCQNSNHAAMPAVSINDQAAGFMKVGLIEQSEDFGEGGGFGVAAFGIQPLQLFRNSGGSLRVFGGEKLNNFGGDIHASGGVDAGG